MNDIVSKTRKRIDDLITQYNRSLGIGNVRASGAVIPHLVTALLECIEDLQAAVDAKVAAASPIQKTVPHPLGFGVPIPVQNADPLDFSNNPRKKRVERVTKAILDNAEPLPPKPKPAKLVNKKGGSKAAPRASKKTPKE